MEDEELAKGEEGEEDEEATNDEAGSYPVKNKRKNFQPRSIVSDEASRPEKSRRKGAVTPQKCLKPEIMDLSLRETEGSDSDRSEEFQETPNLKSVRKIKNDKCHLEGGSLLSLLNSENRLNNPFGIDLSKFGRSGSVPNYGDVLAGVRKADPGSNRLHNHQPGKPQSIFVISHLCSN